MSSESALGVRSQSVFITWGVGESPQLSLTNRGKFGGTAWIIYFPYMHVHWISVYCNCLIPIVIACFLCSGSLENNLRDGEIKIDVPLMSFVPLSCLSFHWYVSLAMSPSLCCLTACLSLPLPVLFLSLPLSCSLCLSLALSLSSASQPAATWFSSFSMFSFPFSWVCHGTGHQRCQDIITEIGESVLQSPDIAWPCSPSIYTVCTLCPKTMVSTDLWTSATHKCLQQKAPVVLTNCPYGAYLVNISCHARHALCPNLKWNGIGPILSSAI